MRLRGVGSRQSIPVLLHWIKVNSLLDQTLSIYLTVKSESKWISNPPSWTNDTKGPQLSTAFQSLASRSPYFLISEHKRNTSSTPLSSSLSKPDPKSTQIHSWLIHYVLLHITIALQTSPQIYHRALNGPILRPTSTPAGKLSLHPGFLNYRL